MLYVYTSILALREATLGGGGGGGGGVGEGHMMDEVVTLNCMNS